MIKSAEEFHRLRTSDDPEEYGRAAREAADEEVWREVIDRFPDMRFWVAHNKTVPLSILRTLAKDEDDRVRIMVAARRKLDRELFFTLAADADASIRHAVACNDKCPSEVLRLLSHDSERFVAEEAADRLA